MDHSITVALLIGTVVVLVAVLAVRASTRFGLPTLLLYLGLGMAVGESGLGINFDNADLTRTLGLLALVVILAEGGLTTRWTDARPALPVGAVLATVGVGVSVAVTAGATVLILGVGWHDGVLLGAIVSSTDAAAVFATLRRLPLKGRLAATLEAESGFNDAPTVILVLLLTGSQSHSLGHTAGQIGYELLVGAVIGVGVGFLSAEILRRSALPVAGLYPLATVAFTVLAFAVATLAHSSGFLAVYLAGLVLGNAALPHRRATLGFVEGLGWLAQIGLFGLLGLLVSPPDLPAAILPALAIGAVLLVIARPLSILASATWFRFGIRAQALLSWAGLRGAVPIVLATIPISAAEPNADRLFNVVFVLVIAFTLIQGTSLPWVAQRLRTVEATATRDVTVEAAPLEDLAADMLHVDVTGGSRLHGVYVNELRLPRGAVVSLLVRDGVSFVPDANTRISRGDALLVIATAAARAEAERRLRSISRSGRLAGWLADPDTAGAS
ncbi:MAG TPA: potassium/proton antiporter [Mycobacteriales bacterium]|nr:potassium/proton antiporter [Mycobacteriales bacterium]